ncbi:hypothetical protein N801_19885 [Knoellia aerolata DSM 18566]|uniref:Uncharacterized protein n=1 Tax=Knoellia aerolata DSM 18566 TaxID=1385519 RepID=A0A0A0JTE7_9MICO|nr:hypothetical protein N801_19885 [Knoellia aerolata DSM 18566]
MELFSSFTGSGLWGSLGWLPLGDVIDLVTGWCMVCW